MTQTGVLVPAHQPVPLRHLRRRRTSRPAPTTFGGKTRRRPARAVGAARAGCPATRPSTATRSTLADEAEAAGHGARGLRRRPAEAGRAAVRRRGPGRRGELAARASRCGAPTCSAPPPRATSTSSSTCSAPTTRVTGAEAAPEQRPKDVVWRDEAPEGKLDLLMTIDFRMTSSTLLSDVVLPAATWYEKHDINTTDMHPFIHSFNPAIAPPWQSKTDWDAFEAIADKRSASWPSTTSAPARRGRQAAVARHPRGDGQRARRRPGLEAPASASRSRADDAEARRGRARLRRDRTRR